MSTHPSSRTGGWRLHVVLLFLLSIPALAPLAYPGFFQNHNGLSPVYNLIDLASHFPDPAWSPSFGRGADVLRGDGLVPYAVAEFVHVLGFGFAGAIKLVYLLGLVLSALGMFFLARQAFKSTASGYIAAVVYTYFPYHLALIYTRGAFGEAAAWAVFPFGLLAFAALRRKPAPAPGDYVPTVLAFALLLLCQAGLGLVMALAAVVILELRDRVERRPRHSGIGASAGVGLGLLFGLAALVPSIVSHSASSAVPFVPAFVYPFQLFTATWGTALPKGSYLDEFPFQLGIASVALSILAVVMLFAGKGLASPSVKRLVLAGLLLTGLVLLWVMPFSSPLWPLTGGTLLLEYPFQLLGLVAVALSLVAGSVAIADSQFARLPLLTALLAIPLLAGYSYLTPEFLDFTPSRAPLARFNDDELALLGARIIRPVGTLRHGASVDLELQWQALRQVNHDYTVFVHAVDSTGKSWGGQDGKPQDGTLSTLKWVPGRVISDTHTIQIDLSGPPEGYHLEVGIYTTVTGERAATETGTTEVSVPEGGNN